MPVLEEPRAATAGTCGGSLVDRAQSGNSGGRTMIGGYVSPYGLPSGLSGRLLAWVDRMGKDRSLPWVGLGVLEDMVLASRILNSREFLESLLVGGTGEQADYARELLADADTLDAIGDAIGHIEGLPPGPGPGPEITDPVVAIEELDAAAARARREIEAIRDVLVEAGALTPGDRTTPLADLVRLLMP